jgi:hypothetical protein
MKISAIDAASERTLFAEIAASELLGDQGHLLRLPKGDKNPSATWVWGMHSFGLPVRFAADSPLEGNGFELQFRDK